MKKSKKERTLDPEKFEMDCRPDFDRETGIKIPKDVEKALEEAKKKEVLLKPR